MCSEDDLGHTIKIGVSKNPRVRLETINSNGMNIFGLVASVLCWDWRDLERIAHESLQEYQIKNEYFRNVDPAVCAKLFDEIIKVEKIHGFERGLLTYPYHSDCCLNFKRAFFRSAYDSPIVDGPLVSIETVNRGESASWVKTACGGGEMIGPECSTNVYFRETEGGEVMNGFYDHRGSVFIWRDNRGNKKICHLESVAEWIYGLDYESFASGMPNMWIND